jgi:ABC-2 type transport system permease protein
MLSFPVEVLLGKLDRHAMLATLGYQWLLIAGLLALMGWLWRAGIRRFNAYGG